MDKLDFLEDFYQEPDCWNNRYVQITVFFDNTTEKREFVEDKIYNLFGEGAFYGELNVVDDVQSISFSLHKGDFTNAKELSEETNTLVYVSNEWDDYDFSVFKNGKPYSDYKTEIIYDCDEEGYIERGERYFDMEVDVTLTINNKNFSLYCGGGMITEEQRNYLVDKCKPTMQDKKKEVERC